MQHPFLALQGEYAHRLATLTITRVRDAQLRAQYICDHTQAIDLLTPVKEQLGIPIVWMIASFEREASLNFRLSPAQGDPWAMKSIHVPRGVGPFPSFTAAAIWSYQHDGIDKNSFPWDWTYGCWGWEKFNGFGPRDHNRVSGYVFAGTDQYDPPIGKAGKYVADGKWDGSTVDRQLGCVALALEIIRIKPDLAIPGWPAPPPTPIFPVPVTPTPVGVGGGDLRGTFWIQDALNHLHVAGTPLAVDGSYGRRTRNAVRSFQQVFCHIENGDGLAGPITIAALKEALSKI